jgi:parallel beta-helix repeat protein
MQGTGVMGTFRLGLAALIGLFLSDAMSPVSAETPAGSACRVPKTVTTDLTLDHGCTYQGMFIINTSDVILDCRGALIDATGSLNGIRIKGQRLRNITVRNCRIDGAKAQGMMIQQPTDDATMAALPKDQRYDAAVQNVTVKNVSITRSGSVGLYVDSYAQNTHLDGLTISQSGGAGIYLEHSSILTTLENSRIAGNGRGDPLGRRAKGMSREGIAIDSSARNTIRNNMFVDNSAGGIFLYKNCGEHHSRPGSVARWLSSSHNLIERNTFKDEKIGVWVASRQSLDMSRWDCGDPALAPGYYRDRADHNTIVANRFEGGLVGLRIYDDATTVRDNTFVAPERDCVQLGSLKRDEVVGTPVSGTALSGNSCDLRPAERDARRGDSPSGFRAIGASRFSRCSGNVLDGSPSSCSR